MKFCNPQRKSKGYGYYLGGMKINAKALKRRPTMSKQDIAGLTVVGSAVAGLGYAVYIFGVFTMLKWALISFLLIGLIAKVISVLFGIGLFVGASPEARKESQKRQMEYEDSIAGKVSRGVWPE